MLKFKEGVTYTITSDFNDIKIGTYDGDTNRYGHYVGARFVTNIGAIAIKDSILKNYTFIPHSNLLPYVDHVTAGDVISSNKLGDGLYVVEKAMMIGGGHAHDGDWPDHLKIIARKLNDDGTYSPDNKEVKFWLGETSYGGKQIMAVTLHYRMKQIITFVKED